MVDGAELRERTRVQFLSPSGLYRSECRTEWTKADFGGRSYQGKD